MNSNLNGKKKRSRKHCTGLKETVISQITVSDIIMIEAERMLNVQWHYLLYMYSIYNLQYCAVIDLTFSLLVYSTVGVM